MYCKKIEKCIIYIIEIIFLLILSFLTIESIFKTCMLVQGEVTKYLYDNPIIHIITILVTISIFVFINNKELKITKKGLWVVIGIYTLISVIWIFMADLYPRGDQQWVYEIAGQMRKGIFKGFEQGEYVFLNPHQSGLILYEYVLGFIFQDKNYIALQLINVLALLVSFFCIYKITRIMFRNKKTSIFTILGLLMFIPIMFYITFVYGNILGLMFSVMATLFTLKYLEDRKWKYIPLAGVMITLAIILKSNYLITLIAMICLLILDSISNKRWKSLMQIICIIIIYLIIKNIVPFIMKNITGKEEATGPPMIGYIEMGLQESKRTSGWYNRYNKNVYIYNNYDYEKTNKIIKEDINISINNFIKNPKYAAEFFYKKTVSQWNNPTFQSLWINWGKRPGKKQKAIVKIVSHDTPVNKVIVGYMNIIQTLILFGATVYVIINFRNNNIKQLIFGIIFIGGFLFHMIWEAKCQYTLTYFVLLIPYAIKGYIDLSNKIDKKLKERFN